ncbi:hypothetical protein [Novosphingobium mathurense]|uniref:Uncharacterized protein n=1 Tax=Novosphingobium mathurense TaxID=428990 RepID=A0A1U6GTN5_9SPHN|nr:hypothetical protein [Novosphingobium mathurense]SLJ86889.1 hypothetical protein SAMN06295987_101403 [Novosphingobium mathurense]
MATNVMFSADLKMPSPGVIEDYRRHVQLNLERAGLRTVDTISRRGKSAIRQRFAGAGLGRLGNAIGSSADDQVVRRGTDGFSASAQFFTRSRSERTLGALAAYTQGAQITPTRGRWLWIPTDNARRLVGKGANRRRLSPALWRDGGLDTKIGPLILLKSVNGHPILAVENVGVDLSGRKGSAKNLTKRGAPRRHQVKRDLVVMFVGIPRTARSARVNLTEILNQVRAELPAIFASELAKEVR